MNSENTNGRRGISTLMAAPILYRERAISNIQNFNGCITYKNFLILSAIIIILYAILMGGLHL